MRAGTLVIGIGNPDRGDDGVGALVVRLLAARTGEAGVRTVAQRGDAVALLELLDGTEHAIIVDACRSGAPPGTVRRFDVERAPLPADAAPIVTHGLTLDQALELARTLGRLPPRCTVYAIEARSFAVGAAPGPAVSAAALALAERLANELSQDRVESEAPACTSAG
jgi:hydrogenase maturation protease